MHRPYALQLAVNEQLGVMLFEDRQRFPEVRLGDARELIDAGVREEGLDAEDAGLQ